MKDVIELLCYSEKQRALFRETGADSGVVLLDGAAVPVLTTETVTNLRPRSFFNDFEHAGAPTAENLKSKWDDAVIVAASSSGRNYQRLVDGAGKVTEAGRQWCKRNGVEETPDALRAIAVKPKRVMKALRLRGLPA